MLKPAEEQMIVALRQITQAIDLYSKYLLHSFGLTAPQIATLRLLSSSDSWTPGGLADRLHLSPQTMAGILKRLEHRRFIAREKETSDRRSIRVRITAEGRAASDRAPPLLRDRFRAELGKLQTWEQTQMLAVLQRVAAMMQASDLSVDPFLDCQAERASDLNDAPLADFSSLIPTPQED